MHGNSIITYTYIIYIIILLSIIPYNKPAVVIPQDSAVAR